MFYCIGGTVALWLVSGVVSANKAQKLGLLNPVPELGGIGYCVYTIMGPLGFLKSVREWAS